MTIARNVWPAAAPDMWQFQLMVQQAERFDPNWKPPERFAYTVDVMSDGCKLYDFVNPLPKLRNHGKELYDSLPKGAKLAYYVSGAIAGISYADTASTMLQRKLRNHAREIGLTPEQLEAISDDLDVVDERISDVYEELSVLTSRVHALFGTPEMQARAQGILDEIEEEEEEDELDEEAEQDKGSSREKLRDLLGERTRSVNLDDGDPDGGHDRTVPPTQ